jgi:hypothetical protein
VQDIYTSYSDASRIEVPGQHVHMSMSSSEREDVCGGGRRTWRALTGGTTGVPESCALGNGQLLHLALSSLPSGARDGGIVLSWAVRAGVAGTLLGRSAAGPTDRPGGSAEAGRAQEAQSWGARDTGPSDLSGLACYRPRLPDEFYSNLLEDFFFLSHLPMFEIHTHVMVRLI